MTDDRRSAPGPHGTTWLPPLHEGSPRAAAKPSRKRSGVAAGRIAAAGIGIAAMVGLVANMEVANSKTPAKAAPDTGPAAAARRPALGEEHLPRAGDAAGRDRRGRQGAPDRPDAAHGRQDHRRRFVRWQLRRVFERRTRQLSSAPAAAPVARPVAAVS